MYNIYIQENVSINPNSTVSFSAGQNILYAGQSIIITPNNTSIILGPTTYLYVGSYNCMVCLPEMENEILLNNIVYELENFSFTDTSENYFVFPNPSYGIEQFTLMSKNDNFQGAINFKISSLIGLETDLKILEFSSDKIRLQPNNKLNSGLYFIQFEQNSMTYSVPIRIL